MKGEERESETEAERQRDRHRQIVREIERQRHKETERDKDGEGTEGSSYTLLCQGSPFSISSPKPHYSIKKTFQEFSKDIPTKDRYLGSCHLVMVCSFFWLPLGTHVLCPNSQRLTMWPGLSRCVPMEEEGSAVTMILAWRQEGCHFAAKCRARDSTFSEITRSATHFLL